MLDKELEKIKKRNKTEFENSEEGLSEIRLLLENNAKEEIQALKALGMTDSIDKIENRKGNFLTRESFEGQYGRVFTEAEIKELCINYKLRFLESNRYNGPISPEIGAAVARFCKKNEISLNNGAYGHKFMIAAPKEYFRLDSRKEFNAERMQELMKNDPLLFYKIDSNHYSLIHQWGNTFTYGRYFKAFFSRDSFNAIACSLVITIGIMMFLTSWMFGASAAQFFSTIVLGIIPVWIYFAVRFDDDSRNRVLYYSDEVWKDTKD